MSETLSPTPPVECLSTAGGPSSSNRSRAPESMISRRSTASSAGSSPRMNAAIRKADI